jgi:hypothetical protein
VRAIVWVLICLLVPSALFIGMLAFIGLMRRFQIARTRRELERMGFLVSLPYAPESRPLWPRLVAGTVGLVALIVSTSVLTAAPSAQTLASSAGSSTQGAPADAPVVPTGASSGSEHTASQHPTESQGAKSPQASAASPKSPAADAGSDAGAPSTVTALPASTTAIRLDWAPVAGAASYDIERSIDTVAWNAVASTDGPTQYIDVALSSGTTYYYRVVAFVDGQDAATSDVVSATTTVDTSTAPVLISATGSSSSIQLEWGDVHGALSYRIERSPDGTSWTGIGTIADDLTSYLDTGLAPAATFYYRVVAVMSEGETPPSAVLSATTDPDGRSTSDANAAPSEALKDSDL